MLLLVKTIKYNSKLENNDFYHTGPQNPYNQVLGNNKYSNEKY